MAEAYGVFVMTPPPSETILIGYTKTAQEAMELAMKWSDGGITWESSREGISHYGEKVVIEEIKTPLHSGEPLTFPKWDEIFETGVFEQYLAPELELQLNKFGEVDYKSPERKVFDGVWKEISRWLMDALSRRNIEAYSLQGREIYPSDLKDMIRELMEVHRTRGPREWAPARHTWQKALANAFKRMIEGNKE